MLYSKFYFEETLKRFNVFMFRTGFIAFLIFILLLRRIGYKKKSYYDSLNHCFINKTKNLLHEH